LQLCFFETNIDAIVVYVTVRPLMCWWYS